MFNEKRQRGRGRAIAGLNHWQKNSFFVCTIITLGFCDFHLWMVQSVKWNTFIKVGLQAFLNLMSSVSSQEEGNQLKKKNAHSGEYCLSFNIITLKYNKHRNMCARLENSRLERERWKLKQNKVSFWATKNATDIVIIGQWSHTAIDQTLSLNPPCLLHVFFKVEPSALTQI